MPLVLYGLPISPGIAVGNVQILLHERLEVIRQDIAPGNIRTEQFRLTAALEKTRGELVTLKSQIKGEVPTEIAAIIDVHIMILEDAEYSKGALDLIMQQKCNAEWALVQQMHLLTEKFLAITDPYLRERGHDFSQVTERVLEVLAGHARKTQNLVRKVKSGVSILVSDDFSPTDALHLRQTPVGAFVTDLGGGATSHTAILARNLKIPAIAGLRNARRLLQDNEMVIVDGNRGVLIINPDQAIQDEYTRHHQQFIQSAARLKSLQRTRPVTQDGIEISLRANLEMPEDAARARADGADGVGLFRTEFLYLNRVTPPDEEEQYIAYCKVLQSMHGLPVVIRTIDIGADKTMLGMERGALNPALGLRAIRFCLAEPKMFLTQLRALLRASHHGQLRILLPMLSHGEQIHKSLSMLEHAKEELQQKRIPFNRDIAVGAMIEIPAAALALEPFVHYLDFLSIGTNDLIQYTLAIDRSDEQVAHLYDPLHPAVLRLIHHIITTAQRAHVAVAMCGEMAGDPLYTSLLLGMGLRDFSMHSSQLLEVKEQVLQSHGKELHNKVRHLLENPERLRELLPTLNTNGA